MRARRVAAALLAGLAPCAAQGPQLSSSEVPPGLRPWLGRDNCGAAPWQAFHRGMGDVVQHFNGMDVAAALSGLVTLLTPVVQDPHVAFDCATAVSSALVLAAQCSDQLRLPMLAARFRQLGAIFGAFDYQMKGEEYIDQSPWPIQWADSMDGILRSMAALKQQEAREDPSRAAPIRAALSSGSGSSGAKRVAIVSVCDYDPGATPLARLSQINKESYAQRHGYDVFIYEKAPMFEDALAGMLGEPAAHRPAAWSKVDAVLSVLSRGTHEWVMWMDCDSFFMDPDVRLEDIVARAEEQQCGAQGSEAHDDLAALRQLVEAWARGAPQDAGRPAPLSWYEDLLERAAGGAGPSCGGPRASLGDPPRNRTLGWGDWLFRERRPHLIASEDGLMLNTGILLVRASAWSWRFFQHVRWMTFGRSPVTQHPWWEQTAMVYLLQMPFVLEGAAAAAASPTPADIDPASGHPGFAPACALFAQKHLNGYPPLVASALRTHAAFENGDFIISFSGCKVYSSQEVCNQLFLGHFFQVHDVRQVQGDLALRAWL